MAIEAGWKHVSDVEVASTLKWAQVIDGLETGMKDFSDKQSAKIVQPLRTMVTVDGDSFVGMMPCYSVADKILCCKLIAVFPQNKDHPSHTVHIALFSTETGKLLSFMDGEMVTEMRTAAASALSARWLVPHPPRKLAVCGAGVQGLGHIKVLLHQYPCIREIGVWSRTERSRDKLVSNVAGWLHADHQNIRACRTVAECVEDADLIVTATFAADPVLMKADVKPGAHIMAVGAARPNLSELDPQLMNDSQVCVDSVQGAKKESGDVIRSQCQIAFEIGDVIGKGQRPVAAAGRQTTIYKSLGLAVQDLTTSFLAYQSCQGSSGVDFAASLSSANVVNKEDFLTGQLSTNNIKREKSHCPAGDKFEFDGEISFNECRDDADKSNPIIMKLEMRDKQTKDPVSSICLIYSRSNGTLISMMEK